MLSILLTAAAIIATIFFMYADKTDSQRNKRVFKVLAATSFVGLAVANGALQSTYGTVILAALCLSWCGDVALLSRAQVTFLGGLVAFLLGHLAFAVAFVVRGVDPVYWLPAAIVMAIVVATAGRWFAGKAPAKLKVPVVAYVSVIGVMAALAIGTVPTEGGALIAGAALSFVVSDVFVGIDRFVKDGYDTRKWGTPLYFGAQVAFAWTVV
jgi:uncharacterized membrane protein YhhN